MKYFLFNVIILFITLTISLFIVEGIFKIMNFPVEVPQKISHPINYEEKRENLEFNYIFKTNNEGLRYHNLPLEKPLNIYRIYVAGDSYTEGEGIEYGKRFTDLLE